MGHAALDCSSNRTVNRDTNDTDQGFRHRVTKPRRVTLKGRRGARFPIRDLRRGGKEGGEVSSLLRHTVAFPGFPALRVGFPPWPLALGRETSFLLQRSDT